MDSILAVDIGNGDVKIFSLDREGNYKKIKFSSVVADAPYNAIDMPLFEGQRYFLGEEALMRDSKDIKEISTSFSLFQKLSPIFLWKGLTDLGIKPDEVDHIVVGLSLAETDNAESYIKRLTKFKIDKTVYDFSGKISLVPQGLGAKYAIDEKFQEAARSYLIIDIGFSTIDCVDVIAGKVRPENMKGFAGDGIVKIAMNIKEYILEKYKEVVSLKEAKEMIESKIFRLNGNVHKLDDIIEKYSTKYTEQTMQILQITYKREFKKYERVYFVGGGSYFIDQSISPIIKKVKQPEYYNAMGNLYFKKTQINK